MADPQELPTCSWCGRYTTRHMAAYYYGFKETGVPEIDRILCSVAAAGKAYHHTEDWRNPHGEGDESCQGLIQRAAKEAATAVLALTEEWDALRALLLEAREALVPDNGSIGDRERFEVGRRIDAALRGKEKP